MGGLWGGLGGLGRGYWVDYWVVLGGVGVGIGWRIGWRMMPMAHVHRASTLTIEYMRLSTATDEIDAQLAHR